MRGARPVWAILIAALSLALVGCEGEVTIDLAAEPPGDTALQQVVVSVEGLEFRTGGGGSALVRFDDPEPVNLLSLRGLGAEWRMLTDEELDEGSYTGVRLLFDDDEDASFVQDTAGVRWAMSITQGDYAPIDFVVEDQDSSRAAYTLTLDLRQSLLFRESEDDYTLQPLLRSVVTGDAAEITGTLAIPCGAGDSLAEGGAVYLFSGQDVEPSDVGGLVQPFLTTGVFALGVNTYTYTLSHLPAGDYTLAATCQGDADELGVSDGEEVRFQGAVNVELEAEERREIDLQ